MRTILRTVCLLSLLGPGHAVSQECIIAGTSEDHAGQKIPVYRIENPFSRVRVAFDSIRILDDGSFYEHIPIKEQSVLYLGAGIFEAFLYAVPGYEYDVKLPPRTEKALHKRMGPFYEPVRVHLNVLSCRTIESRELLPDTAELNRLIAAFDTTFVKMNHSLLDKGQSHEIVQADPLIEELEKNYSGNTVPLFDRYRRYRYGILKINEGKTDLTGLVHNYLHDSVPRFREPAYMDLFNAVFDDFFYYYSKTDTGEQILAAVNRKHSLGMVRQELKRHPAISSDTLADLVILKEIASQYYGDYFIRDALLILLDSLSQDASLEDYRQMAQEMHRRFSGLMIGNRPPGFLLRDQTNHFKTVDDFRGRYVYLIFCTPDHYACMMEYPFLKSYRDKFHDFLEVVTIMITDNMDTLKDFMNRNRYEWVALYYKDQPSLLEKYNIRTIPSAFLIGPDGLLIQSPATLPSEGFQEQLFRIMRSRGDI
ncbi:MAG: redoxin domain-containing protein [Bacteroidales bacterium]|nr:redoxin domain-containing protein [Bacteroidales bacterium]